MNKYKYYYKKFKLEEGTDFLDKIKLYALIQYDISQEDFNDEFIDDLYSFWKQVNDEVTFGDYDLETFVGYLQEKIIEQKIDLKEINLDDCLKDFYAGIDD